MSDTKFATFLAAKKLNKNRLLAASHSLETLTRDDRKLKLEKRQAKKGEPKEGDKKPEGKPRSGRAVTERAFTAAMTGGALSGPTKQRILRAVNHLLEQKKQEKVDLKTLF